MSGRRKIALVTAVTAAVFAVGYAIGTLAKLFDDTTIHAWGPS